LKAGTIELNGGAIDCVVRNISQTDAALEVNSLMGIPDEFNLLVPGDHTNRRCQVAWRRERRIGVALERSAAWRRTLVEKFPADKRRGRPLSGLR
jgi:hypothetical protein